MAQLLKNLPAMQETQVKSLGQQDPLDKGMVTLSNIMPGECHGQRNLEGYSPRGCKELDMTKQLIHIIPRSFK